MQSMLIIRPLHPPHLCARHICLPPRRQGRKQIFNFPLSPPIYGRASILHSSLNNRPIRKHRLIARLFRPQPPIGHIEVTPVGGNASPQETRSTTPKSPSPPSLPHHRQHSLFTNSPHLSPLPNPLPTLLFPTLRAGGEKKMKNFRTIGLDLASIYW